MDERKTRQLLADYPEHRGKLDQYLISYTRHRQLRVFLLRTFWGLAALTGILLVFLLVERTPVQSEGMRVLFSLAFYSGAGVALFLALRAFTAPPGKIAAAVEIEEAAPGFLSGLSSAAEFQTLSEEPGISTALRKLTISQAAEQLTEKDIGHALSRFSRRRALATMVSLLAILGLWYAAAPMELRRGLARLSHPFSDIAAFSSLEVVVYPGNKLVARGDNLQIAAVPNQPVEKEPVLTLFRPGGTEGTQTEMYPDEAASKAMFVYTLSGLQDSTDYQVTCEKFKSPRFEVQVVPRPDIKKFQVTIHQPEYLGSGPQTLPDGVGDCTVLEGTRIDILGEASQKLKSAEMFLDPGATQPCRIEHGDNFVYSLQIATNTRFSIHLRNEFGLANENPVRYQVTAIRDASPTVAILRPAGDLPFPKSKRLDLKVVAKDDFGVSGVVMYYAVGDRRHLIPMNMKPDLVPVKEYEVEYPWMLDTVSVEPGTEISYFVKAEDGCKPVANVASTPIFKVSMPSMMDVYKGTDEAQGDVASELKDLLEAQKQRRESLQKTFEQIKHEGKLDYHSEQELEKAIKEGEQREKQAQDILDKFQQMQENIKENPFSSPEALEKLQKISQLVDQVLDDEGKKLMKQLRDSLQNMKIDPKELEKLEESFKMDNYLKELDRTVELLSQLRDEMKMDSMAKSLEDLKRRQELIASETAGVEKKKKGGELTPEEQKKLDELGRKRDELASEAAALDKKQKDGAMTQAEQDRKAELEKLQSEIASEAAALEKKQKGDLGEEEQSKLKDLARQQEKIKEELAELEKQSKELAEKKPAAGQQENPSKEDLKNIRDKMKQEDFRKTSDDIKKDLEKQNLSGAQQNQQKMLKFLEALSKEGQKMCQGASGGQPQQMDLSRFIRKAIQVSRDQETLVLQLQGMSGQFMRGQRPTVEGTIDECSGLQVLVRDQAKSLEDALETLVRSSFSVNPDVLLPLKGVQGMFSEIVKDLEDRAISKSRREQREIIRRFNLLAMELMRAQDQSSSPSQSGSTPTDFLKQFKNLTRRQLSLYQQTMQRQMSQSDQRIMEQMKKQALEQRRVREALERLMREGKDQKQLLGRMDDVMKDMQDLETKLLDPNKRRDVAEKQKSVYDRMLKAQKSLKNREEESEERKAEKARDLAQAPIEKALPSAGSDTRDLSKDFLGEIKEDYPKSYEPLLNDYFKSLSLYGGN